jgi:chaperonin GroES
MCILAGPAIAGTGNEMPQWLNLVQVALSRRSGIKIANSKACDSVSFSMCMRDTAMKVRPLGDRIVVRRQEADDKTPGGILLPDTAKNKPQRGKVLAVGAGKLLKDGSRRGLAVKVGDNVLFTAWAGDEYKDGQQSNILLMREEDVLAVVDE